MADSLPVSGAEQCAAFELEKVAEPRPIPQSILDIPDLEFRQRATEAWRASSCLRRLMEQWEKWFFDLEEKGDADPGFAGLLHETTDDCVRVLCTVGLKTAPFNHAKPDELHRKFPYPPHCLMHPPELDWRRDDQYRSQMVAVLRNDEWHCLAGDLLRILRMLEIGPSAVLMSAADQVLALAPESDTRVVQPTQTSTTAPKWIYKLFRSKQFLLLKALWNQEYVPEEDLFAALEYSKARNPKENLHRRVSETNKNLCARAKEIGEMWTISERTREGIKSLILRKQE